MTEPKKEPAMDVAIRYLEHRARTEKQVVTRLQEAGYTQDEINDCLTRLKDLHYVDDTEYALSYLRRNLEKRRGRLRFFRELKERGIERDIAQQAIYLFEDEENLDLAELEKENAFLEAERFLDDPAPTEKERARAGRRLASLGYDTSLIYHILGRFGRRDLDA